MILDFGKRQILGYFAGVNSGIADTIILGVGDQIDGTNVGFEVLRLPVDIIGMDYTNNQVIFKATMPLEYSGVVSEVALYQGNSSVLQEDTNINLFPGGTAVAEWSTLNTSPGVYIKEESLRVQNQTSQTTAGVDLTDFASDDVIKLITSSSTSSTVTLRIGVDASNYYEYTFNVTAGKSVVKKALSSRTTTGTVNTKELNYMSISASSSVVFEGLRLENTNVNNPNYGMIAYQTLTTPITKPVGSEREVEYALRIGVA